MEVLVTPLVTRLRDDGYSDRQVQREARVVLRALLNEAADVIEKQQAAVDLVRRLARMPNTNENLLSTWCRPEWEDLSEWWQQYVTEARALTGETGRNILP